MKLKNAILSLPMLHIFRKYQKIIFYMVTIVIITTFVFFGTYQTFAPSGKEADPVVMQVGKQKIRRSLLTQMTLFLKSEQSPFPDPQGLLSTNYLNSGIISNTILNSPLFSTVEGYSDWLAKQNSADKGFKPYVHPQAPMLSADSCWSLFAPELKETLEKWQSGDCSFETRVKLYQAERKFPAPLLAQMLRYQEREYANMQGDMRLAKGEVTLFGYHDLESWFGPDYMEASARLIFEGAAKAKEKGHIVSKEEVLSEIYARTQALYEGYRRELEGHIAGPQALFQTFVRYNGFDEETLVKVMESVMLFERLLDDVSQAALVDTLALEEFYAYAHEYATVEVTQMPKELRFGNVDQWKQFELYLAAVAPQEGLGLPAKMDLVEVIKERAPELIGERYELYVGHLEKRALEAKVSMRETWEWEEQNLEKLQERFPELKSEKLENFAGKKRTMVDAFARQQIVAENPQWIEEAFSDIDMKELKVFVTNAPFTELTGISNFKALVEKDETVGYSENNKDFYRVLVMKRPETPEVLSFSEAPNLGDGTALIEKRRDQMDSSISLEEAMSRRFAAYLAEPTDSLFMPMKREMTLSRVEPSFISMDDLVEDTSTVLVDEKEGAYFYRFIDKRVDRVVPQDKVAQAQRLLSQEIKEKFLAELI